MTSSYRVLYIAAAFLIFAITAQAGCIQNEETATTGHPFLEHIDRLEDLGVQAGLTSACLRAENSPEEKLSNIKLCSDASTRLTKLVDRAPGFHVYFHTELNELLKEPRVVAYLKEMKAGAKFFWKGEFRLWDFTLKHTNGNKDEALKWIAILFQDTHSESETQDYVKTLGIAPDLMKAYTGCRANISAWAKNHGFRQFPPEFTPKGTTLYHFYVTALIAKRMKEQGGTSAELATLEPFLLNVFGHYKNIFNVSSSDVKDGDLPSDIYAAYAGVLFATGQSARIPTWEKFQADFTADPEKVIESIR